MKKKGQFLKALKNMKLLTFGANWLAGTSNRLKSQMPHFLQTVVELCHIQILKVLTSKNHTKRATDPDTENRTEIFHMILLQKTNPLKVKEDVEGGNSKVLLPLSSNL